MTERPPVPVTQRVFGDIVYWVTILCAIICMIGPLMAFIDMDENVLNPHYMFDDLFSGMAPTGGEDLAQDATAGTTLLMVEHVDDFEIDQTVTVKDDNNSETATVAGIDEDAGTIELSAALTNSYSVNDHAQIAGETIWQDAKDGVEGGHFWIDHFTTGDGFTQFGLVLGCAVGFFARLGAAVFDIIKERSFGWAIGAIWIAIMIGVSVLGIVSVH